MSPSSIYPLDRHVRACWLGAMLVHAGNLLRVVRESGAVPQSEFPPAVPMYAAIPVLLTLGGSTVAWGIARLRVASTSSLPPLEQWAWLARAGALLLLVGCFMTPAVVPGTMILVAGLAVLTNSREKAYTRSLPWPALVEFEDATLRLDWRRLPWLFLGLVSLASLATFLLGTAESVYFTSRFVPDIISPAEFSEYRIALGGLAVLVGLDVGFTFTAALLGLWAVLRLFRRWGLLAPSSTPRLLVILVGQGLGYALYREIHSCLGDEADQLGLTIDSFLLCVLLGGVLTSFMYGHLKSLDYRAPKNALFASLAEIMGWLLLWSFLPPRFLLGARAQRFLLLSRPLRNVAALAAGGTLILLLCLGLYPVVEDFRMQLFNSFTRIILLVATILLFIIVPVVVHRAPWQKPISLVCIFLLALGAGLWWKAGRRPECRLVAHEYTRFAALAESSVLIDLIDPFPKIGLTDARAPRFPHHAKGGQVLEGLSPTWHSRWPKPLIIILVWDAARPDRLSALGYERPTTPHLERLAKESIVFTRAISNATATTTGVRNLLSGCYSSRYMLGGNHQAFVTKELAAAGYSHFVVTVTGNDYNGVSAESFRRGWEPRNPGTTFIDLEYPNKDILKEDVPKTRDVGEALENIARERPSGSLEGVFAYMHMMGPHIPWLNNNPVREFGTTPSDRYDGEIAKVDALLGNLVARLKKLGAYEDCLLIVTADHGTGLGEHGRLAGYFLYEEQIRVPLFMKIPGIPHRVVDDLIGTIDVAPTLVDLLGSGAKRPFHGRSLLPLATGTRTKLRPRPLVSFCSFRDSYAIIDAEGRWKLHHHRSGKYEVLFDLAADPHEQTNLISRHPDRADSLRTLLDVLLWEGRASYGNPYHYRAWEGPR